MSRTVHRTYYCRGCKDCCYSIYNDVSVRGRGGIGARVKEGASVGVVRSGLRDYISGCG